MVHAGAKPVTWCLWYVVESINAVNHWPTMTHDGVKQAYGISKLVISVVIDDDKVRRQ